MNASFYSQSYQKMWIVGGEVYGWYRTSLRLKSLDVTTWEGAHSGGDTRKLEEFARNKAFDLHVSGYVFAVFAGPVWAWATGIPSTLTVIGETGGGGVRTFMHEFGHNLGLPDLYNYENLRAEPVGEWDLMDRGDELSAYSRLKFGWIPLDSVTTLDSGRDVTLSINSLDSPSGVRALKVKLYASISYYLVESRHEADGLHLVIYYIKGSIESGKGSIVIETVLTASDKPVFVGKRIVCALIVLDAQPDAFTVELAQEDQGKKAQDTFEALKSASNSITDAWLDDRVQGLDEAKQELDKAWQSFHNGDFDTARTSADKAGQLAKVAKIPESYSQFQELRPSVEARIQNASAFKSSEAIRYLELAKEFLRNADGNFTRNNFDAALDSLSGANETLTKAYEAERIFTESQQARIGSLSVLLTVAVASVVIIFLILVLSRTTRRKVAAR
jgi:hypothetical protein